MENQKLQLKRGCLFLTFGALVIIFILGSILYYSKKHYDGSEYEQRQLYKANFLENVDFQGEILQIENLGWKYRYSLSICMKLNKLEVDSSKIIKGNPFFNLDWKVTGLFFRGFNSHIEKQLKAMNEVHLNKNWNGKLMLFSSMGDSIDITSNFIGLANSKTTTFCRDFIE